MTPIACILFVLIFCILWFGSMKIIGFVFESRNVPLIKLQSRAFFPGDIALGVMFLALYREYGEYKRFLPGKWYLLSVPVTIALCLFNWWLLKRDRAFYKRRAANSPTKLWHDIMGFYVFEIVISNMALHLLIEVIIGHQKFGNAADPIMFTIALAFYICCDIWDVKHPATRRAIEARHIPNWKPIWKKAP